MSKAIPISKAKEIAKDYGYDIVIVVGINNDCSGHTTTYGKNRAFCHIAGNIGQKQLAPYIFGNDGILANFQFDSMDISEADIGTSKEIEAN